MACRWDFLCALESSGVEGACYWYVVFRRSEGLLATAVLSSFSVHLDLLINSRVERLLDPIRRLFPSFLSIRALFCGLPISIGKNSLCIIDPADTEAVLARLVLVMSEIAEANQIRYLCLKEFAEEDARIGDTLERHGFLRAHSMPTVILPIIWAGEREYLQSLRHGYRRQILRSQRRLYATGAAISEVPFDLPGAMTFTRLYRQVMHHAKVRLEVLPDVFFAQLTEHLGDQLTLLIVRRDDDVVAAALLAKDGTTLRFLLAGLDYEQYRACDGYVNLLFAIVRHAINRHCHSIDLGQTSYWAKLRLGGQCTDLYFCLRCENTWLHTLLAKCRSVLFPRRRILQPRVFASGVRKISPGSRSPHSD